MPVGLVAKINRRHRGRGVVEHRAEVLREGRWTLPAPGWRDIAAALLDGGCRHGEAHRPAAASLTFINAVGKARSKMKSPLMQRRSDMNDSADKQPPAEQAPEHAGRSLAMPFRHPIETLRREIDRLFDDFAPGARLSAMRRSLFDLEPFRHRDRSWGAAPAVDVSETDQTYEITAELPGMSEQDIEVKLVDGGLSIRGQKHEDKKETHKGYYMRERRFGSFERYFPMPDGVDAEKIAASFDKGVLKITLPKTAEASQGEKRIEIKAG
ncbi:Hsp20/alpha crystallin family protein [Burkholderia cepacia]|nr:Hsp20/alpha crystallin family protein [Burkholderia cepacia]